MNTSFKIATVFFPPKVEFNIRHKCLTKRLYSRKAWVMLNQTKLRKVCTVSVKYFATKGTLLFNVR